MDTLSHDRQLLQEDAAFRPGTEETQVEMVATEVNDHDSLFYVGWDGCRRIHNFPPHADLRGGKGWIEHDWTEDGIAEDLVAAGMARNQIVLSFKHPEVRSYTEYAAS